ncbi:MAG TPA: hypothetical protein VHU80_10395, partial [Polyangiaceae bacterium]|nr:hypothetical protein [Polyangiaceae bacterium]
RPFSILRPGRLEQLGSLMTLMPRTSANQFFGVRPAGSLLRTGSLGAGASLAERAWNNLKTRMPRVERILTNRLLDIALAGRCSRLVARH